MTEMAAQLNEGDILDYLKENPEFFDRHPNVILKCFAPDRSIHPRVSDFQQFMIKKLQEKVDGFQKTEDLLIEHSRANMTNQNRVNLSVLTVLHARSIAELVEAINVDLAVVLDIDYATLCLEDDGSLPDVLFHDITRLNEFDVDKELGQKKFIELRPNVKEQKRYYKHAEELIVSDALSRLEVIDCQGMLVLGSREEDFFHPDQGTEHLNFLTRVIEICLNKLIEQEK